MFLNVIFGPTCETHVQTAVQKVKIPSLCRFNNTLKVMAVLRPLIEKTQGALTRETLIEVEKKNAGFIV